MNADDAFTLSPDQGAFFPSGPASMVLAQLQRGLDDASPVVVLTGEPGTGKTTVVREAIARWGQRVSAVWFEVEQGPADKTLLKTIRAFGGHGRAADGRPELIARMCHALSEVTKRGCLPVLVVDDAHAYEPDVLAEVGRMESAAIAAGLTLKLIFVGQARLNELLERPNLDLISQRLAVSCRLEPMEQADTREYLNHRVTLAGGSTSTFSRKAAREIHDATRGVPSAINELADEAQRYAEATNAGVVTPEHVRAVVAATRRGASNVTMTLPAWTSGQSPSGASLPRPAALRGPAPRPVAPSSSVPNTPGGPRQAVPVPPKVKRVPPPPPQNVTPPELPPDLDSGHPLVKEWVSRFTDGQPLKIGGSTPLPITDPADIPGFQEAPSPAPHDPYEFAGPLPMEAPPAAATPAATPAPAPAPGTISSTQPVAPNVIPVAPVGDPVVTPEQLMPPPLVLNEAPAAAPTARSTPAAPKSAAAAPKSAAPAPKTPPAAATPTAQAASPTPPGSVSKPSPSRQMPKPATASAKPPSGQMAKPAVAPKQAPPASIPAASSLSGSWPTPRPRSAQVPTPAPAAPTPAAAPAPEPPPVVLTSKDVKAHRPSKAERRQQKRAAAAAAAAAAATPAAAPASPIAKPPAPAVGHAAPAPPTLAPPTLAPPTPVPPTPVPPAQAPPAIGVFEPNLVELGRAVEDETTPRVYRVLAALIPIVLILGMAATAVVLSRKSAFDREPAATSPTLAEAPAPAREVEPTPAPVAAPITPPLVVTPDTGEVPKVVAEPRYCLSVGTYLFSDRARARTAQLTKKTSMESWVVTGTSDGSFTYRVMLGKFASRSEAERVADKLLGRGVVSEALVEALPKNR